MEFIHDDFLAAFGDGPATLPQLRRRRADPGLSFASFARGYCQRPAFRETYREIWLEGDHYKWRAMRANGIDERFCTGDAAPYEKFLAWARTVPATLRNPLYHWTHLELKRYFGIRELLDERSAKAIWGKANAMLATPELSVRGMIRKFRILALCTSDDPCDDLCQHKAIAADNPGFRVYPTFRPDQALLVNSPGKVQFLGGAPGGGEQYRDREVPGFS